MSRPTLLFVHGSWHTPAHFALIREMFEKAGYPTSCPRVPGVWSLPPIGLIEDAQCLQDEVAKLVEQEERDVLIVRHSYGGVISTQAVEQCFAKSVREKDGKKGGVLRILFMCAFLLQDGESLAGAFGGELPPFITSGEQGLMTMHDPGHRFYNDLPPPAQQHWIGEMLKSPRITNYTPISHAAYLYHPVTYLYCEGDQALPFEVQKMMGVTVDEETCKAGHSPYLSMPEKVLEVVQKISG